MVTTIEKLRSAPMEPLEVIVGVVIAAAAGTAVFLSSAVGIIEYSDRKRLVKKLMPAYRMGYYNTKPTIFNVRKMTKDLTQIPKSLNDLGDVIRTIESESGQPSQLVVKVGDDKYLVGDLRKRAGECRLEMQEEYNPDPFEREKKQKNPHKKLTGTYSSFEELKKAVEETQPEQGRMRRSGDSDPVYLIERPDQEYYVGVHGINLGRASGRTYNPIGKIIFPLLQNGEKVTIDKI